MPLSRGKKKQTSWPWSSRDLFFLWEVVCCALLIYENSKHVSICGKTVDNSLFDLCLSIPKMNPNVVKFTIYE